MVPESDSQATLELSCGAPRSAKHSERAAAHGDGYQEVRVKGQIHFGGLEMTRGH